ncbi:putative repeat protein (TIGR01451 family) [Ilumatobacter fluminis]|uniref:Putative repeat protein (TIGR01451 family) n=1 Tax=Ilumatobacter fluminis TaxID=467091 RepID=A0A4R7HUT3_9ACTN|nr:DUF11 domain-containing protein [Ilumatobacter fluminis]TDT14717.1 putative repeat protein (TIGR01451 family) [Ilumatobacter fluminis]
MERTDSVTTWLRVVISAALVITLGTALTFAENAPVAEATNGTFFPTTSFQIDGNLTPTGTPAPDSAPPGSGDWTGTYGPGVTVDGYPTTGVYYNNRTPDPCNDSNDNIASGGIEVGEGPVWPEVTGEPNKKTDLLAIRLGAEAVAVPSGGGGSQINNILYVAFETCNPGASGTFNLTIFIEGGDGLPPYLVNGTATGSTDDYLVIFDFQGGSTGAGRLYDFGDGEWTLNSTITNTQFQQFLNTDRTVGEVALNLTSVGIPSDGTGAPGSPNEDSECRTITVSGQAATPTGGSLNSQVKDILDVDPLQISNCGNIDITKLAADGDATSATPFHYVLEQIDGADVHDAIPTLTSTPAGLGEPDGDLSEIDADIDLGETHQWMSVLAQPDYTLDEVSLPDGWELQSIECSYFDPFNPGQPTPAEGATWLNNSTAILFPETDPTFLIPPETFANRDVLPASCTIVNDALGITIQKVGTPDDGTTFTFDIDNGVAADLPVVINGDSVFQTVPDPGTYVITEDDINALDGGDLDPDWTLTDISCTDGDGATSPVYDLDARTATVVVDGSDDDIVCTFTNEQASRIVVEKVTDPDTGDTFDFDVVGPDTVALDGVGNGGSDNTGDIAPGDYTITEDLTGVNILADPDWVLTSVDCGSGDEPIIGGNSVSVGVAAGEVVTCTFNNQQQGSISIDKQVVDPGTTDIATDQDATFSFEGAVTGDITTTAGVTDNGDALTSNPVMPGSYTVTENTAATPGYTLESVDCTDPTGDSVQNGDGADIELGSGEAVSCTFTNSRNQATFTLQKQWGDGTLDGEVVDLDASAAGPAPIAAAIDTTATSPAGAAGTNTMTVYSGQTITLSETFQVAANGDAYTTTLSCGTLPAGMVLTPAVGNRSATLTVGNDPGDVTCTFVNTPKTAGVVLQKIWDDNSNVGDSVLLAASNGSGDGPDNAASVAADEPEFLGPDNTDDNSAFVPVVAGQTVTMLEAFQPLEAGDNYTTTFDCVGETGTITPTDAEPYGYTLDITPDDVAAGTQIVCSFTNTRIEVDLVLEKDWVDAKIDDAVTLSATGSDTTPIEYASTADTATETDTSGTFTVYAGETLTLAETWDTGDPAAYDTELVCVGATDTDPSDGLDIDPDDTSITCTWENTRRSVEVQVAKDVRPDGDDGTFSVTLNDVEVLTDVGDGDDVDPDAAADETSTPVTILVGDPVALEETATGPAGLENYTSTLACDNGITPADNDGVSGDFVVPSTLDSDSLITCTFVNTRKEAPITLTKSWGTSPVDDDVALLDITGGLGTVTPGVHSNDGGLDADQDATSTAYAGETLTLEELLGAEYDASWYDITLECNDTVGQFVIGGFATVGQETTGSITVPSDPTAITCEFTNQRKSAALVVDKSWVNGKAGDVAGITIAGIDPASPGTGDSTAIDGNFNDPNVAQLPVWVGEVVDVSEIITLTDPQDAPRYDTTLVCDDETSVDGRSGTVTVDADEAGTTITCDFTNTRRGVNLTLGKDWADSPDNGDAVDLSISGGLIEATVTAPEATNSNDGDDANDADAVARGLVGETLTLAEVFIGGDAANYDTDFECLDGQGALLDTQVTYVDGALTATLDITADLVGPVSCEYTNTRKRADFELQKTWLGSVEDDAVELTVDSTSNAAPVDALAPGGDGDSTEVVATTVYAGETLTVSEIIDPDGTNVGVYDPTGFTCVGTGNGTVAPDGLSSELTVTAAEIDAANLADATISCEFENSAQRGNIVIVKSIDGTTDGEFDFAGDWSADGIVTDPAATDPTAFSILTDGLNGSVTFTDVLVPKDGEPYSIVETDPTPEYDGTEVVCSSADADDTSTGGDTTPLTGSIDLDNGETVTCTFTNTERSTIVVVKDAQPDSAADFAFTGDLGAFTLDDDADGTLSNTFTSDLLNAEAGSTYTVNETPTPGWTLDIAASSCTNGDTFAGAGVVIDPDPGTTVTCTFVNTANPAGLTATKAVSGVEGAWGPFTFTLSGGTFTGDAAQDVDSADPVAQWTELVEGQTYTIVENEVPGYETGAEFACTLIDPNDPNNPVDLVDGSADAGFQFTAVAGGVFSCDITNVAIPADVSVAKTVSGVADTQAWSFDFSITAVSAGAAEPTLDSADTTVSDTGSVTSTDTVDWSGLTPGGTYTVAETAPGVGYLAGELVCTGVVDTDDAPQSVTFVAPLGGDGVEISCDITNTAIPSEVSVTKTVDGGLDDAQAWAFEFTLSPDATPAGSQTASGTGDGNDTVTWTGLVPGETYTVAEVLPGDNSTTYDNGVLTCSIGDSVDDQTVSFVAPLGNDGVEVACTVTNTAQSDVSYDKVLTGDPVRNDDGTWSIGYTLTVENAADAGAGTYDLSDTFLFGEGVSIVADSAAVANTTPGTITTNAAFDGDTDPVIVTGEAIAAGATHTYVVTVDVTIEVGPDTDGDCVREDDGGTGFLNEMSIAIDGGEPQTTDACAGFATLTLVKVVVNDDGGNATVADFPLTADGPVTLTGISGTDAVSSAVPAGSYTLSEDQLVEGYLPSLFLCDAGTGTGTVTLADGDNATCTITNDDEPVDLEITKNDDGVTVIAGGAPFDYTITVQNVGTRDADLGEPVTVVDELPLPLQWVSFPDDCVQAGQTLTCDIDPALMTVGADPVVITATVSAPADAASGTYVNEATVTTEDDPVCEPIGDCEPPPCEEAASNNNIDCEPTPVDREGAIQIVKTDDVAAGDSVLPGESFEYTLEVTNIGTSSILPGLVVTDDLPAQLSLVSVSGGAGWTCNNADPIECTYAPSLAPGASTPDITVVVSVNADATGTEIDNTAVVQGAVDRECPEPTSGADLSEAFVPACNQVTDDDDETTPMTAQADLAIVKTASVATVGAGGEFNWVLDVENLGPAPAIDVVVGDLVPTDVTVTAVSSSFFDCSRSGNDVTCTRPQMAVGASGTITITVSVPANDEGGIVENVGTVEASTPDPNLDNNSDDASVVIVAQIPPTSVVPTPTIPATGSNSTEPVVKTAMVLLLLGALGLAAARRRRPDGVTTTI